MPAAPFTLIFYYIPADHDDPEHPNVFVINKDPESVNVKDIIDNFPLPGRFYFRFQMMQGNETACWLDTKDPTERVPLLEGRRIFAKVLRIRDESFMPYNFLERSPNMSSDIVEEPTYQRPVPSAKKQQQQTQPPSKIVPEPNMLDDIFA